MTTSSVAVKLIFWTRPDELIPEAEALAWFAAHPDTLEDAAAQEGVISIESEGAQVRIGDCLLWMVPLLCFDAVVALKQTGEATADAFSNDTHVELRRQLDAVTVDTGQAPPLTVPAGPLSQALADAGERFIALVERLWPATADLVLEEVRPRLAAARAALAAGG